MPITALSIGFQNYWQILCTGMGQPLDENQPVSMCHVTLPMKRQIVASSPPDLLSLQSFESCKIIKQNISSKLTFGELFHGILENDKNILFFCWQL